MVNWLIIGIMVILLDIFIGLPLDYILTLQGVDWLVLLSIGLLEILLPMLCFFLEIDQRSKYPVRVEIKYNQSENVKGESRVKANDDRCGQFDIKDDKGKKTGGSEWRLLKIKRAIQGMSHDFVYDKNIWFGFKSAPHVAIEASEGLKGEEFYPIEHQLGVDEKGGKFRTVYGTERAIVGYKVRTEIITRNTKENFWKDHLFDLLKIGGDILIIIMLFLCFLQLVDVSKNLQSAAGSNAACATAYQEVMNNTASAKTPTAGNVGGIPFGIG
jgi:hypothetical protein